jgi:hypothetical protein
MNGSTMLILKLNKPVCLFYRIYDYHKLSFYASGINYERKVKKNARDAAEEHTRYLSLLGTVGPELTQEK